MIDPRRTELRRRRQRSIPGIEHIRAAATELLEGDGDELEHLTRAVGCLEAGLSDYPQWPAKLREDADVSRSRLAARGCFESTVSRMRSETVREVSNELWQFCQLILTYEPGLEMEQMKDTGVSEVQGLELLREARALLNGEILDRQKLRVAAHRFWSAEYHCDEWPFDLRRMAEQLTAQIFRHGPIDEAFRHMSDDAAIEIRKGIVCLCDEAERLIQT